MPFSDYSNLLIAIKTWRNTFVRADDSGSMPGVNQQTSIGAWEKWGVIPQSDGTFAFKSAHGRYMRADDSGSMPGVNQQTSIGAWEKWTAIENVTGSGVYSFKSAHNKYLRAGDKGEMNQQTSIGAWEKFTIQVVSDCLEVYDVVYSIDQAKIFDTQPKSLASQSLSNSSEISQSMNIQIQEQYQTKSSWSQKDGIKVGVKVSMKAKIPFVGESGIDVSTEYSHEWTSGTEETKTQTFSATLPLVVPAKSRCTARVTFHESKMDIPWKAKAAWRGVDDARSVTNIGGTWDGTSVYDIQYTVDAPVHL